MKVTEKMVDAALLSYFGDNLPGPTMRKAMRGALEAALEVKSDAPARAARPTLTKNETLVLLILIRKARLYSPVSVGSIQFDAWDNGSGIGIGYDATNRALRKLVEKGLATKPSRGYYLPVDSEDQS